MKALDDAIFLYRYKHSGCIVAISFFISQLITKLHMKLSIYLFKRKYLVNLQGKKCFCFNGAFIPYIKSFRFVALLKSVFEDTFFISCYYGDKYDKDIVDFVDSITAEGPYGYKDEDIDVTVKEGDIVIDAGAWVGDFGAYAASKGAIAYCFEPVAEIYNWLCETAILNDNKLIPVKYALGNSVGENYINLNFNGDTAGKIVSGENGEKILITTLDSFVTEYGLEKVDFIKADIEGFERYMLEGGQNVLRDYAPKLAICTYHLPDDPEVLANIIKSANPNYKIVQMRHKLFAAVTQENKL